MKVSIPIEFIVTAKDEDELDEGVAETAAEQAAYDYLSFVRVSGHSGDVETVTVHVDGFGKCQVSLANDE